MAVDKTAPRTNSNSARYALIGALVVAAFFGAYRFAQASGASGASSSGSAAAAQPASTVASSGGAGGSCCGGASGATGSAASGSSCCAPNPAANKPAAGTAQLSGGVQRIDVKVTTSYSPNVIHLKAGIPAEINFSSAQGCTGIVQSQDLGFQEDLTTGPKTVKLQGLTAGTYGFSCGMNMVRGQVVVE